MLCLACFLPTYLRTGAWLLALTAQEAHEIELTALRAALTAAEQQATLLGSSNADLNVALQSLQARAEQAETAGQQLAAELASQSAAAATQRAALEVPCNDMRDC